MAQPLALDSAPAGQASGWRKGQDLIDALPYVDRLTPEEKQRVDKLIQEEMRNSPQRPAAYLKDLPPAYELKLEGHPVLQAELQRVREGKPMEALDVTRYRLDKPPLARRNDFAAWKKALENAHSQLGHQYNRVVNLELLLKFGPKAWRVQNASLEAANARLSREVAELRGQIDSVNRERKLQQTAAGQELATFEAEWQELVAKNGEIERACRAVEQELALMQAAMQPPQGDAAAGAAARDAGDEVPAAAEPVAEAAEPSEAEAAAAADGPVADGSGIGMESATGEGAASTA